jgi:hypothetical protein
MMKRRLSLPLVATIIFSTGVLAPLAAQADNLLVNRVQQEKAMNLPSRGMSMAQVEKQFGAPTRKLAPRGGDSALHPTINRWEYPSFIVYFQGTHVIHSVLNTPAGNNLSPAGAN